jgi:hypothetical protein
LNRPADTVHLSLSFLERPRTGGFGLAHLAISDDGSRVAYSALNRLWIRRLDETEPIALDVPAIDPFFSPDGQWVGFFTGDAGLAKVPAAAGNVAMVARTTERPV